MKKTPRHPEPVQQPPLILRTEGQTFFQKFGFRALTVLFWLLFLFLFRLALTPFAWWLGLQSVYELLSYKVDAEDFALQLSLYGFIIVLIGIILIGWARYNQFRFTRRERRTFFLPPVSPEDTERFFLLSANHAGACARSRRLVMSHDACGQVVNVEEGDFGHLPRLLEPTPVERFSFLYRDFSVRRDATLQWVVTRENQELFRDGFFENCRKYVDTLTVSSDRP